MTLQSKILGWEFSESTTTKRMLGDADFKAGEGAQTKSARRGVVHKM